MTTKTDRNSLRRAIIREIELIGREAGAKAIAGEAPIADVERLKALQCVLAALPEKHIPFSLAVIVGIACLLIASFALAIEVPWARVQLDLTTKTIAMRLDNDLSWHGTWRVDPKQVRLGNFTRIVLPPEYGPRAENSLELNVQTGSVRVGDLFFDHGALLTIATSESGAADIVASGGLFRGYIDVSGEVNGHAGLGLDNSLPLERYDSETPPGRFSFMYNGQDVRGQRPPFIHGSPVEALAFPDIKVTNLSFVDERASPERPDQPMFTSQITSGTITMTDTGEQISIVPATALRLANIRGRISSLLVTSKDVQMKFEGTVNEVTLGTGKFSRSLKPTILEWLFHQQKLGLFWGALTFLWGMSWSAGRLISGAS
jgi:hypothetical protein